MRAPSTPPSAEPPPPGGSYDGPVRIAGPLRRLLLWLTPAYLVIFVIRGAVPGLLLTVQVGQYDEGHKVANLAVISTVGAMCAMIAQPVAGVLSDRTRSRWGRRDRPQSQLLRSLPGRRRAVRVRRVGGAAHPFRPLTRPTR